MSLPDLQQVQGQVTPIPWIRTRSLYSRWDEAPDVTSSSSTIEHHATTVTSVGTAANGRFLIGAVPTEPA